MIGSDYSNIITLSLILTLVPLILMTMTSFIKTSIIFALIRSGFGINNLPSKFVEVGLSLAITIYVLNPLIKFEKFFTSPNNKISINNLSSTINNSIPILYGFMLSNSRNKYLDLFRELSLNSKSKINDKKIKEVTSSISKSSLSEKPDEVMNLEEYSLSKLFVVYPAFLISEITSGCIMGFLVLLPFLIIDLVISNLLVGVGLTMVSPTIISLPIKVILFVVVDGWSLVVQSLIYSYS